MTRYYILKNVYDPIYGPISDFWKIEDNGDYYHVNLQKDLSWGKKITAWPVTHITESYICKEIKFEDLPEKIKKLEINSSNTESLADGFLL